MFRQNKKDPKGYTMSNLPLPLLHATPDEALASLCRLLEAKKITPARARSLWAAYRVARSEAVEYYASYEVHRCAGPSCCSSSASC